MGVPSQMVWFTLEWEGLYQINTLGFYTTNENQLNEIWNSTGHVGIAWGSGSAVKKNEFPL